MKVLVTGGNGFLGRYLIKALVAGDDYDVVGTTRSFTEPVPGACLISEIDVNSTTDWSDVLIDVDVVIHCAARVHVGKVDTESEAALMDEVNVKGTRNLAVQAAAAGVKRFVFVSSIGVLGERTTEPFRGSEDPRPGSPYARSKLTAEAALASISEASDLEYVIIRPPMIYGPEAPGNFARLVRFSNLPLPLGAATELRSFVSVWNLVDLIVRCLKHPAARNQIFLVCDGEDVSTREFIEAIASAKGEHCWIPYVPSAVIYYLLSAIGKKGIWQSLFGALQVDDSCTRTVLSWRPPMNFHDSVRRCFSSSGKVL